LFVALLWGVATPCASADDDPEPPKPKGQVADLFARLKSKEFNERNEATRDLFEKVGPEHLDMVIWFSKRGKPIQREIACRLLCYSKVKTASPQQIKERIVPALLARTGDRDLNVRRSATDVVPEYANHSKAVIERLFELLDDKDRTQIGTSYPGILDYSVAGTALHSLRRVHKLDKRIVPLIWEKAYKGDMRKPALLALGDLGQRQGFGGAGMTSKVLPLLATVFSDPKEDMEVRAEAARALCRMKMLAKEIFPLVCRVLRQAKLRDPGKADEKGAYGVQWWCMSIIDDACRWQKISPEVFKDAVPELVKIFEKDGEKVWDGRRVDYSQRRRAIETLKVMGPSAKAAVPALQKLIRDLAKRGARYPNRENNTPDNHLFCDADLALKQIDK
jgi:HEAT repeat protein